MDTQTLLNDPEKLVQQLDATVIRERIDDLDRERAALVVLLRAALRTEKQRNRQTIATGKGGDDGR
jgi:hypothetical protein